MRLLAAGVFLVAWGVPSRAAAQLRDGLASTLTFSGGSVALGARALEPGWQMNTPDPLRDARVTLRSPRAAVGGLLRETLVLRSVRWSLGVGVATLPGSGARVDPVAEGFEAQGRPAWMGLFDFSVGRQFRVGPVLPYVDARAALYLLSSRVELRSPAQGRLSVTDYQTNLFELGPRAGFWLPLSSSVHLDLSVRAGLLGPERFGADLGLGFYLPWGRRSW